MGPPSKEQLKDGVDHVVATSGAFAAVKQDGSVITSGSADCGGNPDESYELEQPGLRRREAGWLRPAAIPTE